jgi:hypothetical protein
MISKILPEFLCICLLLFILLRQVHLFPDTFIGNRKYRFSVQ